MEDFRSSKINYSDDLVKYVRQNKMSNNVKFLGEIPYSHVLELIKSSIAVINPSFFEGWSSTVEECKSINKTIILSNIDVHLEQKLVKRYLF